MTETLATPTNAMSREPVYSHVLGQNKISRHGIRWKSVLGQNPTPAESGCFWESGWQKSWGKEKESL